MSESPGIVAVVGSYRKGGIIDTAVDEILASAREEGADTEKIYLIDRRLEFCINCRTCTQQPGQRRGACVIEDDMNGILEKIEHADAVVLGSPVNAGTVTAVMKIFIERLVCYTYWPWGMNAPGIRNSHTKKRAVIVASSAAPSVLARISTDIVKTMKKAAGLLGCSTEGVLFIGMAAKNKQQDIGARARKKARALGKKLAG